MSTARDPDLIVAAWLDDGPTDLPTDTERSIAIAVRTLPQARSRVDRLARRIDMTRFQTLGLVAAVAIVAVVGLVAISAFGGRRADVGGQPTVTAPASPSASPTPSIVTPPLIETFLSPWYGYTIDYPAEWVAISARNFFKPAEFSAAGGPSEWLDVIHPTTSNGLLRIGSAAIPEGGTAETVSEAFWGPQDNLEDMTIAGKPALVRDQDGEVEAVVDAGDRVYVVTLFSGQGGSEPGIENHRALFDALMASLTLQPALAFTEAEAALPELSEALSSPSYGYTIRYPSTWEAVPAESPFDGTDCPSGGSECMDVIHPLTSNGLFRAGSAPISAVGTAEDVKRGYWGVQDSLEDIIIAGHPAQLLDGGTEFDAAVESDGRVYFFKLYAGQNGEDRGIGNARGMFEALLGSVELSPESAVEAPVPSP